MVNRKIFAIVIIVFLNFCGNSITINKTVENRNNGILLRCEIKSITELQQKRCKIRGILFIINETNRKIKVNMRELALKINDQTCLIDDEWKQLLITSSIEANQIAQVNINTIYEGAIKNDDFKVEIVGCLFPK
jgi:hypothetical protein